VELLDQRLLPLLRLQATGAVAGREDLNRVRADVVAGPDELRARIAEADDEQVRRGAPPRAPVVAARSPASEEARQGLALGGLGGLGGRRRLGPFGRFAGFALALSRGLEPRWLAADDDRVLFEVGRDARR